MTSQPSPEPELRARIARHIDQTRGEQSRGANPPTETFADLALAAFAFQYARIAPYRALCDRRGVTPATTTSFADVPLVPALAFKSLALHAAEPVEVFRSSGTAGLSPRAAGEPAARSTHYQPFPELYRAAIDASFPTYLLEPGERPAMLSLIPPREVVADSSLSFMADHVMTRFAEPTRSLWGAGARGLELAKVRSWLGARQREGRPVVVLATSLALAQLLDGLGRIDLRFRLPAGSRLFETGGFKTREGELAAADLQTGTGERLGIPADRVIREYGMTELSSQLYTANLLGGAPDVFVAPPWVHARILDPETLAEAPAGQVGLVAIFDLANLGSALHLLTEDLGAAVGPGIRLVGRATGAELRGCSLTAEELAPRIGAPE